MCLEKKDAKSVQDKLKILEDQGFIAKRYDKSYKLQGKPAYYYLLPRGARELATYVPRKTDEPLQMKRLYRDKDASEQFMLHCRHVFIAWLELWSVHGTKLTFVAREQCNYEKYDFFPHPLPDAFIRLKSSRGERQTFLHIFEAWDPYFVLVRCMKRYVQYASGGDWDTTSTKLPTVLFACSTPSVQKRIRKKLVKELLDNYDDLYFATTTLDELLTCSQNSGKIWRRIDLNGDDPDDPVKPVGLQTVDRDID